MKQLNFFKNTTKQNEFGGSLSVGKRRTVRPLSIKKPLHLVLKSEFARGPRSLIRHRQLIDKIVQKAKRRFNIKVYEFAIVSNHIHLLIKGNRRTEIQNFFRMIAGHIAQEILQLLPFTEMEKDNINPKANKFWQSRIYSRIVSWGRELEHVKNYVMQNTLEALGIIPYQTRKKYRKRNTS